MSTGSQTGEAMLGMKKSKVELIALSRVCSVMKSWVRVPVAWCACQRAIEALRSILKAVGKGVLSGMVLRRATTLASSMFWSQMS